MYFNIVRSTAMQNGDKASPSIILAGQALKVTMHHNSWSSMF